MEKLQNCHVCMVSTSQVFRSLTLLHPIPEPWVKNISGNSSDLSCELKKIMGIHKLIYMYFLLPMSILFLMFAFKVVLTIKFPNSANKLVQV